MKQTTLSLLTATLLLSPALATEELGEIIVISSTKLPQKIKHTTANITVITAEDIEERGYQSIPEVLSHTPGFAFASNGGAGQTSSVFIRGLSSDNLLILLDGIPLTDYTQPSAAASLEHISLNTVAKIEITKGGQSGIWGAGAAAGTVNIISKGGTKDQGSISLQAGSHGTKGIGIDLSKVFEGGALSLGAHLFDTDGISAQAPNDAEEDGYRNNNYYLKGHFDLDNYSQVSFFLRDDHGKYDFDSSSAEDTDSHGDSEQRLYGIGYRYQKEALSIDAKVTHRTIDRGLAGAGTWGPWTYDTTGESTQYTMTAGYQFSDKNSLALGVEHNKNEARTDSGFGPSSAQFKNSAAFASYTHTVAALLGADTTFNAVLRYDKFDQFDNKATYRLGVKRSCNAIEGLHTAANLYTGYKAPSLYQFSNASSLLKPESIKGYELSIGYKKYINLTYFSNEIQDKIDYSYDPATFTTNYFNSGDGVKTTGMELSGEYAFGDSGLILGGSITHMFDFQDDSGKDALRIPENSATLSLDYYFNEVSHVGVIANYVGKRRDMDYSAYPASDVTLKSYTTVDLTYNTQFNDHFNLSVTAKNIFDKEYETVKGYSTEGRSIYATMEYKF